MYSLLGQNILPGSFVGFHSIFCPLECLQPELLNVRLTSDVVHDGVVLCEVRFGLIYDQPLNPMSARIPSVPAQACP